MGEEDATPSFAGDPPAAADGAVLPDRRELALVAFERTRMPLVITDPKQADDPIVLVNHAFLELTGYSANEVIGRNCRFLQGPDTAEAEIDALRQALVRGDDHIDVELLNYRKDGSPFWNQLSIFAVHNDEGKLIYCFASQKDITDRRRAQELEATERLLLMEVDHRSLNALALVKSIVHLCQADSIEAFSATVRGRVDVLAQAHQLLARSGWAGVDLYDMLSAHSATSGLTAEGENLFIPAGVVQPLALVLHELLSNARQHGALKADQGRVSVRWHTNEGALILNWMEEGQNASPPLAYGFGLNIITRVLESQLGGRCSVQWTTDGMQAFLEIPLRAKPNVPRKH